MVVAQAPEQTLMANIRICIELDRLFIQELKMTINSHNSVNCDRPGECSPEKDCLR